MLISWSWCIDIEQSEFVSSLWQQSSRYLLLRLRSVETGSWTPNMFCINIEQWEFVNLLWHGITGLSLSPSTCVFTLVSCQAFLRWNLQYLVWPVGSFGVGIWTPRNPHVGRLLNQLHQKEDKSYVHDIKRKIISMPNECKTCKRFILLGKFK